MVGDQGLGLEPDQVTLVLMVPMQVLEVVVEVVELANMAALDMVQGQDQVQGLVHIVKDGIMAMEGLLMLVVPVGVGVEDKPKVPRIPMLKDMVAALVLDLAMLTGIGMDQTTQVLMLMAMVVAQEIVKMVAVAVVLVPELGMAMPTHKFHISQSKVGAHRSPSLFEVIKLFVFFVPFVTLF